MTSRTSDENECAQALLELANSWNAPAKRKLDGSAKHLFPKFGEDTTKNQGTKVALKHPKVITISRQNRAAAKVKLQKSQSFVVFVDSVSLDHSYSKPSHEQLYSENIDPGFYDLLNAVESSEFKKQSPDTDQMKPAQNQIVPAHISSVWDQTSSASAVGLTEYQTLPYTPLTGPKTSFKPTTFLPGQILIRHDHQTDTCNLGNSESSNDSHENNMGRFRPLTQCEFCQKQFILPSLLEKHLAECHAMGSPVTSESMREICKLSDPYQELTVVSDPKVGDDNWQLCQICGENVEAENLVMHFLGRHSSVQREEQESSTAGQRARVKGEAMEEDISSDKVDDHGTDIITCDICYAFVKKNMLSKHVAQRHFNMVSGTGYTADLEIPPATALPSSPTVSLVASGLLNSSSCRDFMIQRYLTDAAITLSTSQFQENPYAQEVAACYTDSDSPTKQRSCGSTPHSSPNTGHDMATAKRLKGNSQGEEFLNSEYSISEDEANMKTTLAQHGYINLKDTQPLYYDACNKTDMQA